MRNQKSSLLSDPLNSLNITAPVEETYNLPDIDYHNIKKAAMVLRALNHKLRQQVLKTIPENKRIDVTDIYQKLRLEQLVASQHLAILRKAGIVSAERNGKFIFYTINSSRIEAINEFVKNLVEK
jgi:DNA-binding transcriptional ArsR family regulator